MKELMVGTIVEIGSALRTIGEGKIKGKLGFKLALMGSAIRPILSEYGRSELEEFAKFSDEESGGVPRSKQPEFFRAIAELKDVAVMVNIPTLTEEEVCSLTDDYDVSINTITMLMPVVEGGENV
jgi:hypothetical protein